MKDDDSFPRWVLWVAAAILAIWLAAWWIIPWFFPGSIGPGMAGDMFGSVNALFSGGALFGVIVTVLLQSRELRAQREELRLTREEMKNQRLEAAKTARATAQSATANARAAQATLVSIFAAYHQFRLGVMSRGAAGVGLADLSRLPEYQAFEQLIEEVRGLLARWEAEQID